MIELGGRAATREDAMVELPHDDLSLPLPRGAELPAGRASFDLSLGPARIRILDLPVAARPFVEHHYGSFAEPGAGACDLELHCRLEQGIYEPLPERGGETVLRVRRLAGRRFEIRSHWQSGWIDLDEGRGELALSDLRVERFSMSVENFLRVAMQFLVIERGAFLFHGAGILDRGRVFLFFGPSGAAWPPLELFLVAFVVDTRRVRFFVAFFVLFLAAFLVADFVDDLRARAFAAVPRLRVVFFGVP